MGEDSLTSYNSRHMRLSAACPAAVKSGRLEKGGQFKIEQ